LTDSSYTHLVIIDDESGSMNETSDGTRTKGQDVEKGTLDLIAEQAKLPGKLTVSLVTFDWRPDGGGGTRVVRHAWMAKPDDKKITSWKLHPYGGTPLYDALGFIITETGLTLEAMPEDQRPGKVIFVIGTDGKENRSSEYTKEAVGSKIKTQQDGYGWDFVFIGAGFDAFGEGESIGIRHASTASVGAPAMAAAYLHTNSAVTRSRGPGGQSVSYSPAERDDMAEKSKNEK